jgi:DNA-binding GntR family transcriptional regulator
MSCIFLGLKEAILVAKSVKDPHECVVEQIKREIVFGRLRPRERLIEAELGAKFGASRHQVRAAFVELERMKLVIRRRNKGVVVADFSIHDIEEFFEIGALLQAEAAKRTPLPLDRNTQRRLDKIYADYCAAIDRLELEEVGAKTFEFHSLISEASNNKCLADMIRQIWTVTLHVRCYAVAIPDLLERARQEHAQILEALRSGNRRELVRLYVDHSWPALEAYMRMHGAWTTKSPPSSSAVIEERSREVKRTKAG